jgi:hypothetical protein
VSIETYYTVIGVSETASLAEIKAAYRELVRQVHPDSVPNASPYWKRAAEEKTKEINEAYQILSDVLKRREYDRLIAEARQRPTQAQHPNSTTPQSQTSPPSPQPQGVKRGYNWGPLRHWAGQHPLLILFMGIMSFTFLVSFLPDSTSSSQIVHDGTYSSFPCEKGQSVSPVDHKPCKSPPEATKPQPTPIFEVVDAPPPNGMRKKPVPISSSLAQAKTQTTPGLITATEMLSAKDLPPGVFNIDPMDGHGQSKLFMGTECSWKNVDAESTKKAMETGALANHTFMISPSDETCYVWNRDINQFLAKGAVRGEPIVRGQRIVAYKKPDTNGTTVDKPNAQLVSPQRLTNQVPTVPAETRASSGQPDLSSLTFAEKQSIEAACSHAKYIEGPAAYDRCLNRELAAWEQGPKQPNLSSLTFAEKQSIEAACSHAKYIEGPTAYDRCLNRELAAWEQGPKEPSLSGLTYAEKQSIESACSHAKYIKGPAAYDRCLIRQLEDLVNYHQ